MRRPLHLVSNVLLTISLALSVILPIHAASTPAWRVLIPNHPMPLLHQGDGLGVDASNTLYVWDSLEARIKEFSPSGRLLTWWHVPQSTPGSPWAPNHLAVDSRGAVSVLANGISRYSPSGKLLAHWSLAPNPVAVATGGSGNVFVL